MSTSASVVELDPGEEPKFILAPLPIDLDWIRKTIGDWPVAAFRIELSNQWYITGWVDDTGLLKDLPFNFLRWNEHGDVIVGKCIITKEARDVNGRLAPMEEADMDLIKKMLTKLVLPMQKVDNQTGAVTSFMGRVLRKLPNYAHRRPAIFDIIQG